MAGCQAIRSYRTEKKLTQEALGKELGVTGITVSRWETGARPVDHKLVPKIARKTGIAPRDLRPDYAEIYEAAQ